MRQLSQIEQALTITGKTFPLSAVCVLKIQQGPSVDVLQASLEKLQSNYPLLNAFIKESDGRFCFEVDIHKKQVVLKIVERKDDDHWQKETREELNMGFDHGVSPLMRTTYLTSSSDKSEIILSFHHAVMDYAFVLSFANQLLSLAGEEQTGTKKLLAAESKPSPLLSDVLPSAFKMPRVLTRFLPFIYRQMKDDLSYKKRTGKIKDLPIPASSENDIYTLGFTEEETIALIKWSRKNKVSLNSIISASMLMVVNRNNYNNKKNIMRLAQFANLRPYLQPPLAHEVEGCFIAMMRFSTPMSTQRTLVEIASNLDRQMRQSLKRGDKFLFTLLSKMLIKKSFREQKERLSATALSYAGPVNLKKQYGHILVSDIHGFITNNGLGPELSGFGKICFGRLSLDLNFLSKETSREKAMNMVKELRMVLLESINN